MNLYKVTFVSDYFVLSTTIDSDPDVEMADEVIAHNANELIRREYNFSPLSHSYDVEIEEQSPIWNKPEQTVMRGY